MVSVIEPETLDCKLNPSPASAPPPAQMCDSEVARTLEAEADIGAAAAALLVPETVSCEFEVLAVSGGVSQWSEVTDPKGRSYYWNKTTKETSWTPPTDWNSSVQNEVCELTNHIVRSFLRWYL